ncbi:hypothetical protein P1X14_01600 [Sphingomonas sp. AOB5]|uniref:hypothetical protein n=1 Tax=Sphingomonas sp. AOB5 TaxID=3034017 RepID=UPI0023F76DAB|nr:hypothetical protein [Sphingomonas sp. AOB5]MDF7773927.1 hypothetical protein [Sphingomonas sp. AOB5]
MPLIYLSREFSGSTLEFTLPGLSDGFFKILLNVTVSEFAQHFLYVTLNGLGPRHLYTGEWNSAGSSLPRPVSVPSMSIDTLEIPLGATDGGSRGSTFNSEITIGLNPEIDVFSLNARTNSFWSEPTGVGFRTSAVSGGRAGMETLHSIGFRIIHENQQPGGDASGWARMVYYPHVLDMQAEIPA